MKIQSTRGERIADIVVGTMGSWRFIIIQSILVVSWVTLNILFIAYSFDKYPFILLNLLFSVEAAYASPLILMSQNREAQRDRSRDDREAKEVDSLYQNHKLLLSINQQQLGILQEQQEIIKALHEAGKAA